jgi:diguanylate cyclase (GGDEF)-like protein
VNAAQRGNVIAVSLAMLIPVAALLLALLPRIENLINPLPRDRLDQQARTIGARTVERLTAADNLLRLVSTDVGLQDTSIAISSSTVLGAFSNVGLLVGGGAPIVLKGTAPTLETLDGKTLAHLASGQTALITARAGTSARPTLVRAVNSSDHDHSGLLVAELSPEYLWHSADTTSSHYSVCIADAASRPVFCQPFSTSSAMVSPAQGFATLPTSGIDGTTSAAQLAGTSRIELGKAFGAGDWIVSVAEHRSNSIFPTDRSAISYMIAGMAAVVLSLMMAWQLARRKTKLSPAAATPAIGRSATRLVPPSVAKQTKTKSVKTDGEADATDQTTLVLHLLSEIDRAILSGATFDRIIESNLDRIRAILPGDAAALALLDREKPTLCKMILIGADGGRQDFPLEHALDARSTGKLASIPDGEWFDSDAEDALLAPLQKVGMSRCFLVPVFRDGVPAGALVIASKAAQSLEKGERGLARDIAQRLGVAYTATARGQELLFHSLYDSTTELPNRKFFENRLEEEIARARRESRALALLLVDLDKFKEVNDSYGHEAGDILLEEASARLKTCLRTEDLVARIGSDEFAVLLPSISQGADIANVAKKLIDTLSESYLIQGRGHHLTASVGVAMFPKDGNSGRALLSGADFAMHAAKRRGGATYSTYEVQSNEQAQDRTSLTNDLRQAIVKRELVLYFQPQIDLRRGGIVGVEALVRWQHPTRGLIMPADFITIAEQSGLIEQVGDFVRREASTQFRAWESEGNAPMRISINVSSRELRGDDFLEKVENTLLTSGLRPFSLELEITESLLLEHSDHVLAVLKALSDKGVRIAIDDFGTGYSSMAYLKNIPFHVLKIDRFFVKDIGTEDGSDSIVHAIIGVAQGLGKEIVSEGIETEAQRAFLAENGCDLAQGYLWSPPVPADEFAAFVRKWNDAARRVATAE